MALIKCTECGKEFSDKANACPNCGCPISEIIETKEEVIENPVVTQPKKEKNKKNSKIIIIILCIIIFSIVIAVPTFIIVKDAMEKAKIREEERAAEEKLENDKENNKIACSENVAVLKTYIENKDTDGFDKAWQNRKAFVTVDENCKKLECLCSDMWDLYLDNKINKADKFLEQGLISSAYNELNSTYIDEYPKIKKYFDSKNIFKLLSTKQKEKITGQVYSFSNWVWEYKVGSGFKYNKRYVRYGSSNMSLKFDNYSDQVLISGHLKAARHTNWNPDNNIAVEWYNYKVINNIIYVKLKNEKNYDKLFQITKLTDTNLSLKLLRNLEDVNAGQVYNYVYKRT